MLSQLYYINVREGQRDNQEWTIQRHGQHLAQHKQRRQKKILQHTKQKHNTENKKDKQHRLHQKVTGKSMCSQW